MESELMYSDKGNVPEEEYLLPIGKCNIVKEGNDLTLISFGKMMNVELINEGPATFIINSKEL